MEEKGKQTLCFPTCSLPPSSTAHHSQAGLSWERAPRQWNFPLCSFFSLLGLILSNSDDFRCAQLLSGGVAAEYFLLIHTSPTVASVM